jgi:hypothetical protein
MSAGAMMSGVDTVAALAVMAFALVAVALGIFMALVQPIWCLIDCAVDRRRSGASKAVWIVVLVLLYGIANWFYGAFAAAGAWLRRLTRLAWLFAIVLVIAFIALYNMHEEFRRGIDQEWRRGRELMVLAPGAGALPR